MRPGLTCLNDCSTATRWATSGRGPAPCNRATSTCIQGKTPPRQRKRCAMAAVNPVFAHAPFQPAGLDELLEGLDPEAADVLLREYLAEAALRRHLRAIHGSHYASESPQPRALFRIA